MPLINVNQNNAQPGIDPSINQMVGQPVAVNPITTPSTIPTTPVQVNQTATPLNTAGVQEYVSPVQNGTNPVIVDPSDNFEDKLKDLNNVLASSNAPDTSNAATDLASVPNNLTTYKLGDILKLAIERGASDVHLSVANKAKLRIDGELVNINTEILKPEDLIVYVKELIKDRKEIKIDEIHEFDMSFAYGDRRFRINIFRQSGNFAVVGRIIPDKIKTPEELGVPPILKEFTKVNSGLVLVTGPTGSGKSTTIASLLNSINIARPAHIVTIEDPIEFIFPKAVALVNQREFGLDFTSWEDALRAVLRQDPNIVLVGEMRDLKTISSAITLSETGHLVFGTLHTNSASQTMDRIIDVFPEGQQPQIRAQLANVLTGVVAQRLVPMVGGGRRAVMEVLVANSAVRNLIREGKTHQIDNVIQTGQDMGMVSMSKTLADLVNKGVISLEVARSYVNNLAEFNMLMGKSA